MSEVAHDLNTTKEIAKTVLLRMSEFSIPLTPENYHVWFEYCIGSNEDLVGEISAVIDRGKPFSKKINENIYSTYFGNAREERIAAEIQKETQKILQEVLSKVLNTTDDTAAYSNKLKSYSQKLNEASDLSEIKHLMKEIIEETSKMENSSRSLQARLEKATVETKALRNKLEKKERETLVDVLTGLHNRKAFDKKLKELYDEFKEQGTIFSAIMVDIDFFKKFNDTYGHKIGDEVLQIVGSTLKESVKGKDFAARYGGEEFIVLLPHTILSNAKIVGEQIREAVSGKSLKLKKTGQKIENITASIGVSELHSDDTMDGVIERADKALYHAKNSGRNTVKTEKELT
ncbi:MAG: GGDEF domain-containing protein [Planctomycetota bacterium]|jgi:diguanylate cyclase